MNQSEIDQKNEEFEGQSSSEILSWAFEQFGRGLVATSSFQTQSLPLLHLLGKHAPEIDIIFLDTGFHFPETLKYLEQLESELNLNIRKVGYAEGNDAFFEKYGNLHATDTDKCCYLNKVAPLRTVLREYDAWISGVRRDQSRTRTSTPILQSDPNQVLKICAMVNWTHEKVLEYIQEHNLPIHPLFHEGYLSIGCAPCTSAVTDGDDPRMGRWAGLNKTECGLHPVVPPPIDIENKE